MTLQAADLLRMSQRFEYYRSVGAASWDLCKCCKFRVYVYMYAYSGQILPVLVS